MSKKILLSFIGVICFAILGCSSAKGLRSSTTYDCGENVFTVAVSQKAGLVAAGGIYGKYIHVFNYNSGEKIASLPSKGSKEALVFSPDGKYLVAGKNGNVKEETLSIWETDSFEKINKIRLLHQPTRFSGSVGELTFNKEGSLLYVGTTDKGFGGIETYDFETGTFKAGWINAPRKMRSLAIDPSRRIGAITQFGRARNKSVVLVDLNTFSESKPIPLGMPGNPIDVGLTHDGMLVTGYELLTPKGKDYGIPGIQIWNMANPEETKTVEVLARLADGTQQIVRSVKPHPTRTEVWYGLGDGRVYSFDYKSNAGPSLMFEHPHSVYDIEFTSDGNICATVGGDIILVTKIN